MRRFEVARGYDEKKVRLPERSTKGSAGYDFFVLEDVEIPPFELGQEPFMIPTGIRARFPQNEMLMLVNRSSNPKKKGLIIPGSMGIIDSDYYGNPDNDGAMFFAFWNIKKETITLKKGERMGQGIFFPIRLTVDDDAIGERNGGFGSTGG